MEYISTFNVHVILPPSSGDPERPVPALPVHDQDAQLGERAGAERPLRLGRHQPHRGPHPLPARRQPVPGGRPRRAPRQSGWMRPGNGGKLKPTRLLKKIQFSWESALFQEECINQVFWNRVTGWEAKRLKGCIFSPPSPLASGKGKEARKRNLSIVRFPPRYSVPKNLIYTLSQEN